MQYNSNNSRGRRPLNVDFCNFSTLVYSVSSLLPSTCNSSFPVYSTTHSGKGHKKSSKKNKTSYYLKKKNEAKDFLHLDKFVSKNRNQELIAVSENNKKDKYEDVLIQSNKKKINTQDKKQDQHYIFQELFNGGKNVNYSSDMLRMKAAITELRQNNNGDICTSKPALTTESNNWSYAVVPQKVKENNISSFLSKKENSCIDNSTNGKNRKPFSQSSLQAMFSITEGFKNVLLHPLNPPGVSNGEKEMCDNFRNSCNETNLSLSKNFFFDVLNAKNNQHKVPVANIALQTQPLCLNQLTSYNNYTVSHAAITENNKTFLTSVSNKNLNGNRQFESNSNSSRPIFFPQKRNPEMSNFKSNVESLLTHLQPHVVLSENLNNPLKEIYLSSIKSYMQEQHESAKVNYKNFPAYVNRAEDTSNEKDKKLTSLNSENIKRLNNNVQTPLVNLVDFLNNNALLDVEKESFKNNCLQRMQELYLVNSFKNNMKGHKSSRNKERNILNVPILATLLQESPECLQTSSSLSAYSNLNNFRVDEPEVENSKSLLSVKEDSCFSNQHSDLYYVAHENEKLNNLSSSCIHNFNELEVSNHGYDKSKYRMTTGCDFFGKTEETSNNNKNFIDNDKKEDRSTTASSNVCSSQCFESHCEWKKLYENAAKQIENSDTIKGVVINQPAVSQRSSSSSVFPILSHVGKPHVKNYSAVSDCSVFHSNVSEKAKASASSRMNKSSIHSSCRVRSTILSDRADLDAEITTGASPRNSFLLCRSVKDEYSSNRSNRKCLTDYLLWGALDRNDELSFGCENNLASGQNNVSVSTNFLSKPEEGQTLMTLMRKVKIYELEKHFLSKKDCTKESVVGATSKEIKKINMQKKEMCVAKIIENLPHDKPFISQLMNAVDYNNDINKKFSTKCSTNLSREEQAFNLNYFNQNNNILKSKNFPVTTEGFNENGRVKKKNISSGEANKQKSLAVIQLLKNLDSLDSNSDERITALSSCTNFVETKKASTAKTNDNTENLYGSENTVARKDDNPKVKKHEKRSSSSSSNREYYSSPTQYSSFSFLPLVKAEDEASKLHHQAENKNDISMFCTFEKFIIPERTRRESCSTYDDLIASPLSKSSVSSRSCSISTSKETSDLSLRPIELKGETIQDIQKKKKKAQKNNKKAIEAVFIKKESQIFSSCRSRSSDFKFFPLSRTRRSSELSPQTQITKTLEEKSKNCFENSLTISKDRKLYSPNKSKKYSLSEYVSENVHDAAKMSKNFLFADKKASSEKMLNNFPSSSPTTAVSSLPLPHAPANIIHSISLSQEKNDGVISSRSDLSYSKIFSSLITSSVNVFGTSTTSGDDSKFYSNASLAFHASSSCSVSSQAIHNALPCFTASSSQSIFLQPQSVPPPHVLSNSSNLTVRERTNKISSSFISAENESEVPLSVSALLLLQHLNVSPNAIDSNLRNKVLKQQQKTKLGLENLYNICGSKVHNLNTSSVSQYTLANISQISKPPIINLTPNVSGNRIGSFFCSARSSHNIYNKNPTSVFYQPSKMDSQHNLNIFQGLNRPELIAAANQKTFFKNKTKAIAEAGRLAYMSNNSNMAQPDYDLLSNQEQQTFFRNPQNLDNHLIHQRNVINSINDNCAQKRFFDGYMCSKERESNSFEHYNLSDLVNYERRDEKQIPIVAIDSVDSNNENMISSSVGSSKSLNAPSNYYDYGLTEYNPYIFETHTLSSSELTCGLNNQEKSLLSPILYPSKSEQVVSSDFCSSMAPVVVVPTQIMHTPTDSSLGCEGYMTVTSGTECVKAEEGTSLPCTLEFVNTVDRPQDLSVGKVSVQDLSKKNFTQEISQSDSDNSMFFDEKLIQLDASNSTSKKNFCWLRYLQASTGNIVYVNTLTKTVLPYRSSFNYPSKTVDDELELSRLSKKDYDDFSFFSEKVYPVDAPMWEEPQGFGESGASRKWVRCLSMLGEVLYKNCAQKGFRLSSGGLFFQYQNKRPADFEELHPQCVKSFRDKKTGTNQSNLLNSELTKQSSNNSKNSSCLSTAFDQNLEDNNDGEESEPSQGLPSVILLDRKKRKNWESFELIKAELKQGQERNQTLHNAKYGNSTELPNENKINEEETKYNIQKKSSASSDTDRGIASKECKAVNFLCKSKMLESIGVLEPVTCFLICQWVCRCDGEQLSYPYATKILDFMEDIRDVWLEKWFKTKGKIFKGDEDTQEHLRNLISRRLRQMLYQACKYNS